MSISQLLLLPSLTLTSKPCACQIVSGRATGKPGGLDPLELAAIQRSARVGLAPLLGLWPRPVGASRVRKLFLPLPACQPLLAHILSRVCPRAHPLGSAGPAGRGGGGGGGQRGQRQREQRPLPQLRPQV